MNIFPAHEPSRPLTPACPNCGGWTRPHCRDVNTICTWRVCGNTKTCGTYFDPITRRSARNPLTD